jgi:hypothetical protein
MSPNGLVDVWASTLASSLMALLSLELWVGSGLEARRPDWADMGTEKEINKASATKLVPVVSDCCLIRGMRFILLSE